MLSSVSFYGGETTGSVADRKIETAKQETTGGVGVRKNSSSIFVTEEPKEDTVCFKGKEKKNTSALTYLLGGAALTALLVGALGLMHKYDTLGKIKNEKVKKFFKHTDAITEPCYKACSWVKTNCYDKVVKLFKK